MLWAVPDLVTGLFPTKVRRLFPISERGCSLSRYAGCPRFGYRAVPYQGAQAVPNLGPGLFPVEVRGLLPKGSRAVPSDPTSHGATTFYIGVAGCSRGGMLDLLCCSATKVEGRSTTLLCRALGHFPLPTRLPPVTQPPSQFSIIFTFSFIVSVFMYVSCL